MKARSIKTKIIIVVAAVIFATTAVTVIHQILETYRGASRTVAARLESNTNMTDLVFMQKISNVWSTLDILYSTPQIQAVVRGGSVPAAADIMQAVFASNTMIGQVQVAGQTYPYGVFASVYLFDSNFDLLFAVSDFQIPPDFNARRDTPFAENVRQAEMGNRWLSNVEQSPVTGLMQMWMSRPIMQGNVFLGMLVLPVHTAGLELQLESWDYETGAYFTVIADLNGTVAYSNRPDYTGTNILALNMFPSLDALIQNTMFEYTSSVTGQRDFARLEIAPQNGWMIISGVNRASQLPTTQQIITSVLPFVVGLLAAGLIMFLFVLQILKPLGLLVNAFYDVLKGDGDLSKRLQETGGGEIAATSRYYNLIMEEFRKMIISIRTQADELADIGNNLAGNMTETAAAMNHIAINIQSIKSRILSQSASVTQTNATMEQVTVNINKLNDHVEHQTSAVSQSSSAIEEMLANINSVTAILAVNSGNVKALQESAEVGKSSLREVVSDIQKIAKESEGLFEINTVMENIASQTNLLSMNAAIEAAHAGDAGRGFAVVAGEIRKLAESSGTQSKTIGTALKKMKESIEKITRSTETVMNKFEAINAGVKTVADQEEVIRSAMEEQNEGSKQILEASGQVSDVTLLVKSESIEMLEGSREVIKEGSNLERATQEITNGMNEMAAGAEQINRAVNAVNDLSSRNREHISTLVRAISQFKT